MAMQFDQINSSQLQFAQFLTFFQSQLGNKISDDDGGQPFVGPPISRDMIDKSIDWLRNDHRSHQNSEIDGINSKNSEVARVASVISTFQVWGTAQLANVLFVGDPSRIGLPRAFLAAEPANVDENASETKGGLDEKRMLALLPNSLTWPAYARLALLAGRFVDLPNDVAKVGGCVGQYVEKPDAAPNDDHEDTSKVGQKGLTKNSTKKESIANQYA
mmetsp:Transcript_29170/g.66916  ORF Transcript_29170/g.66916 Transcript_29170/m.66916 type:complete len:217 (-) Transcript_29170:7698-8348(-)